MYHFQLYSFCHPSRYSWWCSDFTGSTKWKYTLWEGREGAQERKMGEGQEIKTHWHYPINLATYSCIINKFYPDKHFIPCTSLHRVVLACREVIHAGIRAEAWSLETQRQSDHFLAHSCYETIRLPKTKQDIQVESKVILSSENNLNASVIIKAKVKEVRTNIAIYSHAPLKIHIIGGQVKLWLPSGPIPARSGRFYCTLTRSNPGDHWATITGFQNHLLQS